SQDRDHDGFRGERRRLTRVEPASGAEARDAAMFEEVPGASLVSQVDQRAADDQQEHHPHVGLHREGWYGCGKRRERVVHEHWLSPEVVGFQCAAGPDVRTRLQAPDWKTLSSSPAVRNDRFNE